MVLTEFDFDKEAIINPCDCVEKIEGMPKVAVTCFEYKTFGRMLGSVGGEQIGVVKNANGEQPVYKTKYYYEIERWLHKENLKTSGSDQNPYWYKYTYKDKEREGSKSEKYSVVVKTEKDKIKTYDLKYDEWISLKNGQTLKLKVHIGGNAEIVFE
mgnify:CR=1 FL=1